MKKIVFWQLLQIADDFNQTPTPGSSKQSLGKSIAKAKQALPTHTPLKVKVISNLVTQLSPHSKTSVFASAWRSLNKPGQPQKKTTEVWDRIVSFLEKPDISYCCPGQKDTVYCGKSEDRKKMFKPKHYLLHTIREVVAAYNEEHQEPITYYQMRDVIANERNIVTQALTPDDNCRCEMCENDELLLEAIKLH